MYLNLVICVRDTKEKCKLLKTHSSQQLILISPVDIHFSIKVLVGNYNKYFKLCLIKEKSI